MTKAARRKIYGRILKAAAAAFIVTAYLFCAFAAFAADDEPTLSVAFGESEYINSLRSAGLKADLYLIATASERPGEEAYDFQLIEPYTGIELPFGGSDADGIAAASAAMEIALSVGTPIVSGAPAESTVRHTDAGDALPLGVYLLIIHGADPEEGYVEDAPDGNGKVTVAVSGDDKFLFAPELISLPTRTASGDLNADLSVFPKFVRTDVTPGGSEPDDTIEEPPVQTGDDTPSLLPFYFIMGGSGLLLLILLGLFLIRRRKK